MCWVTGCTHRLQCCSRLPVNPHLHISTRTLGPKVAAAGCRSMFSITVDYVYVRYRAVQRKNCPLEAPCWCSPWASLCKVGNSAACNLALAAGWLLGVGPHHHLCVWFPLSRAVCLCGSPVSVDYVCLHDATRLTQILRCICCQQACVLRVRHPVRPCPRECMYVCWLDHIHCSICPHLSVWGGPRRHCSPSNHLP